VRVYTLFCLYTRSLWAISQ